MFAERENPIPGQTDLGVSVKSSVGFADVQVGVTTEKARAARTDSYKRACRRA